MTTAKAPDEMQLISQCYSNIPYNFYRKNTQEFSMQAA